MNVSSAMLPGVFLLIASVARTQVNLEDLSRLQLQVLKAEVVDRLADPEHGSEVTVSPGRKVVVVTLKGSPDANVSVSIRPAEFAAVYQTPVGLIRATITSASVALRRGDHTEWTISPPGKDIVSLIPFEKGQEFTLLVGFLLPENVTEFSVRYPTIAKGRAVLSQK